MNYRANTLKPKNANKQLCNESQGLKHAAMYLFLDPVGFVPIVVAMSLSSVEHPWTAVLDAGTGSYYLWNQIKQVIVVVVVELS